MSDQIRGIVIGEVKASALSQAEIAARAEMDPSQLSKYLLGKHDIRSSTLERLLAVFGKELRAVKKALRK